MYQQINDRCMNIGTKYYIGPHMLRALFSNHQDDNQQVQPYATPKAKRMLTMLTKGTFIAVLR